MDCHFTRDIWNCYEFLDMCIFMVVYKIQSLLEILHARNNLFQINRNEKIHTFFLIFYSKSYHSLLEFTWDTRTVSLPHPTASLFHFREILWSNRICNGVKLLVLFPKQGAEKLILVKNYFLRLGGGGDTIQSTSTYAE